MDPGIKGGTRVLTGYGEAQDELLVAFQQVREHLRNDLQGPTDLERDIFGHENCGIPVDDRPQDYRRPLQREPAALAWMKENSTLLGDCIQESTSEWMEAAYVLYTWKDLFVKNVKDLPATPLVEHRIPTYPDFVPKASKLPLYTPEEIEWQHRNIPPMISAGIIKQCISQWIAKTKFPRKSSGDLRMVHQYIVLNAGTVKMNYPMRRIEPILNKMANHRWKVFFKADASNGYWAVPLVEHHQYKTAFITALGQFCYKRMGQGLTGACGTFARLKDLMAGHITGDKGESALTEGENTAFDYFVDDDQGAATDIPSMLHFMHHRYFPRLAWSRLTLHPKKTQFFTSSIGILGHECTTSGLRPSADKVAAILQWPEPTSESELLRLLYALPFIRAYIPGRADISKTLRAALIYEGKGRSKRLVAFHWSQPQHDAFRRIKIAISRTELVGADPQSQFHLATDASVTGLGGVLFQIPGLPMGTRASRSTGKYERVVMYLSFSLTDTESRYHTTEREVLAVLRCLEEVRWLIKGVNTPTILYTDHRAVRAVLEGSEKDSYGRLSRWQYRLQEYDLDIVNVPGTHIGLADGLSRIPHHRQRFEHGEEFPLPAFPVIPSQDLSSGKPSVIESFQAFYKSPWYREVIQKFHSDSTSPPKTFCLLWVEDEPVLAFRERSGKLAKCLLPHQVSDALYELHDMHGHYAERITLARAYGKFYWPDRITDIQNYCRSCPACQAIGPNVPRIPHRTVNVLHPLELFGLDYIGPFSPASNKGNQYIIVGVDYFSGFIFADAVPAATAAISLQFITDRVVHMVGWPAVLYTDNGSHFTAHLFSNSVQATGTKHITASTSHPQSVGMVERTVQLILAGLRAVVCETKEALNNWDMFLQLLIYAANTRTVQRRGFSPAEILLGFKPQYLGSSPLERSLVLPRILEEWGQQTAMDGDTRHQLDLPGAHLLHLDSLRERVRLRISSPDSLQILPIKRGDLVLLRRIEIDKSFSHKLETKWSGPLKVRRILKGNRSCVLEDLTTGFPVGKYHFDHLKLFVSRRRQDEFAEEEARRVATELRAQQRYTRNLMKRHRQKPKRSQPSTDLESLFKPLYDSPFPYYYQPPSDPIDLKHLCALL